MANHPKDLTGKTVGVLTVLGPTGEKSRWGDYFWLVRCRCGKEFTKRASDLGRKPKSEKQAPQSCGCVPTSRVYTSKYGGIGDLGGHRFGLLQASAKKRGHHFDVTIEFLWDLFLKQDGMCALTGAPLAMSKRSACPDEAIASLDRIESDKGYIPGNVQWVHPTVNFMKHAMPQKNFITWCCEVADHSRGT